MVDLTVLKALGATGTFHEALKPYQRDGILPTRKAAQEILVPMLWDAILGRDSAKK